MKIIVGCSPNTTANKTPETRTRKHKHLSEELSCLMAVSRSDRTRSFPESAVLNPPEE